MMIKVDKGGSCLSSKIYTAHCWIFISDFLTALLGGRELGTVGAAEAAVDILVPIGCAVDGAVVLPLVGRLLRAEIGSLG